MDERRSGYSLKAPGYSGSPRHLPGRGGPLPGLDDRLVEAEVTRDELLGGRRVAAFPAEEPHASQHLILDYVVQAHLASGYAGATDLLTRHDVDSDFASDTCVRKIGIDPATGARHLEEIAFEVVSEQSERNVTEKALRMHRRGVRRIFTIVIKDGWRVREWLPESQSWRPLEADAQIEDACLVKPLPVSALLDAAAADDAVVEALAAKGNPELLRREAAVEAKARAEDVLMVLETRGVAVSESQRQEILGCHDLDRLDRWLRRATLASSAGEVTSEL
ncbi:MAG TPA: hypothetical protein VGQ28_11170 [Thermoanaerobaculia bacterium]|nr:hypothetical protein [Thermoanaerobaculia bacterium]